MMNHVFLILRRVESVILPVGGSSGSGALSNPVPGFIDFGEHQTERPLLSLPLLFSEYSAALRLQTITPKDCDPGTGRI